MSAKQSCRTCRHYATNGQRMTRGAVFPCVAPAPEIAMPDSIARSYGFIHPRDHHRSFMERHDGASCPVWEARQ